MEGTTGTVSADSGGNAAVRPGEVWRDTNGDVIEAHGGGVIYHGGRYYWHGESKGGPTLRTPLVGFRVDVIGVTCYSSTDLLHWKNEGVVLPAVRDDRNHDLHPSKVLERPKVIYNDRTGKFVLWMHVDHEDYAYARAGVAVSDSPTGPFQYLGSFAPCDSDLRDFTVFKDWDGSAYAVFTSEWNSVVKIVALSDDYLRTVGECVRLYDTGERHKSREAPAVFRTRDRYFLMTSGCTGWGHNPAAYAEAPSMRGPWVLHGNPCVGPRVDTSFDSQVTFVLPIAGQDNSFVYLADRWIMENLGDSRYVWLPLEVEGDQVRVEWREQWLPEVTG